MMKQVKIKLPQRALTLAGGMLLTVGAFAQSGTVKGHVLDATGEPVMGATITANGKAVGITDLDGNFTATVTPGTEITITYLGMQPQTLKATEEMSIILKDDAESLNEVVVIGYGAVKKSDLTGSVTALKPDSKNKGLVVNAQDLIEGKIAGVSVTDGGGTPGGGATIRIRGGSSLNASNDPLIVIDGVPMDNNGIKGLANPLSMVNPQDIESFNVLKDASATAIYGSRGSNGVIIITTKKGHKGQKLSISYNGSVTTSMKQNTIDVMTGDEYRDFVKKLYAGTTREEEALANLGTANTNWQDLIYRTAWSQDHNVTLAGSVGNWLPFRVSVGYTNQQGIVQTSDFQRYTASLNLNPSFLQDHLKMNVNVKGMWAKNRYADGDAIGAAVRQDPTQDPYSFTSEYGKTLGDQTLKNFGGYFEWTMSGNSLQDSSWPYTYNTLAPKNPLAELYLKNDRAISRDLLLNGDIDYQVHGFEDLRLHATVGADISYGKQTTDVDGSCPLAMYYGNTGFESILKRNLLFNAYIQYYHDFNDAAKNHFDIMGGYEWQHFWRYTKSRYFSYYPSTSSQAGQVHTDTGMSYEDYDNGKIGPYRYKTESYLVSFFGRANWSLMDGRYMVTATVRNDGSSRFQNHWALFPSFAFAWRISDENKFKEIKWLSNLKLRLGYGMTGQQDGIGDYNYFDIYTMNSGTNNYYPNIDNGILARPNAINKDLKWETTTTYNVGLDWGILDQRLSGSFDWYYRKTTDLINTVYIPAGSNFRNQVTSNVGSLSNTGFEAQISWNVIRTKDWNWTLDYNLTYNHNKITKLTGGDDSDYYIPAGGISSGTGNTIQAQAVGHPINSFLVYQQIYDKDGKPIEGAVVDRNGDGSISEADRYYYKSPNAPVTMGLSSRLEWKNWDLGFSLRASLGNYVFMDYYAGAACVSASELLSASTFFSNRPTLVLPLNWQTYNVTAIESDYWVRNASFLKCDNITLGYSFYDLFKTGNWAGISGRVYFTCSNVFTITKYDGLDPEIYSGIDNNMYPRPRSFILGLSLNF